MPEFKGLTIKFRGEESELTAALHRIRTESRETEKDLKGINTALRIKPDSVELLNAALIKTKDAVQASRDRIKALSDGQADCNKKMDHARQTMAELAAAGKQNTDEYRAQEEELKRLQAQHDALGIKLAEEEAYLERNVRAMQNATGAYAAYSTSIGQLGMGMQTIGTALTTSGDRLQQIGGNLTRTVTVPLAAVATASMMSAVSIDTALTNVRKTVDMSAEGYERLRENAIELSRHQPISAETILNIEAMGGQLGVTTGALEDFAQVVAGLDVATNLDAETAATELARFANIVGMSESDYANWGAAVVDLGNNFATTESELVYMGEAMASAGKTAGMSSADILGVAAAASSLGMQAQAGGTAFSRTLNDIGMAVSNNSEDLEKWAKVAHMSVDDFRALWQQDSTEGFIRVIEGMQQLTEEGMDLNQTLDYLGINEVRQSDFLRRLAGGEDLLRNAIEHSNSAWKNNNALTDEVSNRNESLASKLQVIANRIKAIAYEIGQPLADAALDVLDAIGPAIDVVTDLAKEFANADQDTQRMIIGFAAMAAAAGPVTTAFGRIESSIGGLLSFAGSSLEKIAGYMAFSTEAGATTFEKLYASGFKTDGVLGLVAKAADKLGLSLGQLAVPVAAVGLSVGAFAATLGAAYLNELKYQRATDHLTQSNMKLEDAVDRALLPITDESRVLADTAERSYDAASALNELASSHERTANRIDAINDSASQQARSLEEAQTVLHSYFGGMEMNTARQVQLKQALEELNSEFGTNYEYIEEENAIIDRNTGEYLTNTEAIDDNIRARLEEIQTAAKLNVLQELMEQHYQDVNAASDAWDQYWEMVNSGEYSGVQLEEARLNAEQFGEVAARSGEKVRRLQEDLELVEDEAQHLSSAMDDVRTIFGGNDETIDAFKESLSELGLSIESFGEGNEYVLDAVAARWAGSSDDILRTLADMGYQISEDGKLIPLELAEGIEENSGEATGAAQSLGEDLVRAANNGVSDADSVGRNLALGMKSGIVSAASEVVTAAWNMAHDAVAAAKAGAEEHSPSRATREIGAYMSRGLALGIEDAANEPVYAARTVARDSIRAMSEPEFGSFANSKYTAELSSMASGGGLGSVSTTNLYIDGAIVNDSPAIQEALNEFLTTLAREVDM